MSLLRQLSLITIALVFALGLNYASAAWSNPTSAPTGGNVDVPINVGSVQQAKTGILQAAQLYGGLSGGIYALQVDGSGRIGIGGAPSATKKLNVTGDVLASGTICDTNGCIGGVGPTPNLSAVTGAGASTGSAISITNNTASALAVTGTITGGTVNGTSNVTVAGHDTVFLCGSTSHTGLCATGTPLLCVVDNPTNPPYPGTIPVWSSGSNVWYAPYILISATGQKSGGFATCTEGVLMIHG